MEAAQFDEAYYSAAAQVMPVLFLALLLDQYWRPQKAHRRGIGMLNVSVMLFFVLGEYQALDALSSQVERTDWQNQMIVWGIAAPLLRIVVPRLWSACEDTFGRLHPKLFSFLRWVGGLALVAWFALLFAGVVETSDVVYVGFFFALALGGLGLRYFDDSVDRNRDDSRVGDDNPDETDV